jgi:hypothetical protein
VDQDGPLLAVADLLLAHVLERVLQRLDRRLDRRLDVAALQPEAVDLPLDVLEPGLRLLEQQVGALLRLADDAARVLLGGLADVVRDLLRGRCSASAASIRDSSWRR